MSRTKKEFEEVFIEVIAKHVPSAAACEMEIAELEDKIAKEQLKLKTINKSINELKEYLCNSLFRTNPDITEERFGALIENALPDLVRNIKAHSCSIQQNSSISEDVNRVLLFIRSNPGVGSKEIRYGAGIEKQSRYAKIINKLRETGKIGSKGAISTMVYYAK